MRYRQDQPDKINISYFTILKPILIIQYKIILFFNLNQIIPYILTFKTSNKLSY